jgi:hypothetical protein
VGGGAGDLGVCVFVMGGVALLQWARNAAPTGLSFLFDLYPGLTAWVNEFRAYGAGLQQRAVFGLCNGADTLG